MDAQANPQQKSHWLLWIISLILAFLLGYLLAHRMAPSCLQAAMRGGGGGAMSGGGGGGAGKMDADLGGGGGEGDSMRLKRGVPGDTAGSGNGDDGLGAGKNHADGTSPDAGTVASKIDVNDAEGTARNMAGGQLGLGPAAPDASPPVSTSRTRSAGDFRYDRTMIPRYDGTVGKVGSALVTDSVRRTDSSSVVAISTPDSFDATVGWYRGHLPASWPEQKIADLDQLAKQLTPQQIMQTFQQMRSGGATPTLPATAAADREQIAIFAPSDSANNHRGVMIVQRGTKPTTILLQRKVQS